MQTLTAGTWRSGRQEEIARPLEPGQSTPALFDHFFTVAVPVSRPDESLKVMVLPLTLLVQVILPDESL